jgi:hypothetical protein
VSALMCANISIVGCTVNPAGSPLDACLRWLTALPSFNMNFSLLPALLLLPVMLQKH